MRLGKFFLILVALSLVALTSISAGRPSDSIGIARALEVANEHATVLMELPDINGVGVSLDANGRAVIMVLTETPGASGVPAKLDGLNVVTKYAGEIMARPKPPGVGKPDKEEKIDPTARFDRPVPIGVSTGHPNITAGTIGARVTDSSNVFALSNNHVYADSNNALIGDAVIQPGTYDGGESPADDIGTLYAFVPIDFNGGNNVIDAAIANTTPVELGNATPSDGYGTRYPQKVCK